MASNLAEKRLQSYLRLFSVSRRQYGRKCLRVSTATDTSLSLYVTAAKARRVGWFLLTCSSMGGKAVQLSSKMADTFDVSSSF